MHAHSDKPSKINNPFWVSCQSTIGVLGQFAWSIRLVRPTVSGFLGFDSVSCQAIVRALYTTAETENPANLSLMAVQKIR
ncbi:MAG: hypothetical protein CBB71_01800 [Rhodopirellula sp. TMED11]|nr:MAG: hypothetical protein CBB71_01800 [Rhodopirellula sp. TMED11]